MKPTGPAAFLFQKVFVFLSGSAIAVAARLQGAEIRPGAKISAGVYLGQGAFMAGRLELLVGSGSVLDVGASIHLYGGRVVLQEDVYLGPYSVVYGHGGVEIGKGSLISMHTSILSSQHKIQAGEAIASQSDRLLPTKVGEDVWIGAGSTIMGGVTIGDGSVIGAGSVVTKTIPAGVVAWGSPATVRRKR